MTNEEESGRDCFMEQANQILAVKKEMLKRNRNLKELNGKLVELQLEIRESRKEFKEIDRESERREIKEQLRTLFFHLVYSFCFQTLIKLVQKWVLHSHLLSSTNHTTIFQYTACLLFPSFI